MRDFLYCLFFPHEKNNHRAKALHFRSLSIVISLLIISSFFFSSDFNPLASKIQALADISTQELLKFTNDKRAENGLPPLERNEQLENAASMKAEDMFAKNYWAHNAPDGTTPWVFIKKAGYEYIYAGENLARGFSDSSDVVNAWMASPDHRKNLLSENFKEVGFAVKAGRLNGEDTFLVVQEFGNRTAIPVARKEEALAQAEPQVLALDLNSVTPKPSNGVSYEFIVILIASLIAVLAIDLIVMRRRKVVRFVGHNADHIIFLIAIIIIVSILGSGHVL
jgi:uncharacterized protein YkwD